MTDTPRTPQGAQDAGARAARGDGVGADGGEGEAAEGASNGPDRIVHAVTRGLHDGGFARGERLTERGLAERFGLPRAAVRDALRRLQDGGLLEFIPYRGAQIRNPTMREQRDGLLVLERLLGLAARLAAERIGEGDMRERIAGAWAELQRSPLPLTGYDGARARQRFHAAIAQASGARELLRRMPGAQMHLLTAEWPSDPEDPLAAYRAVVRAILSGAPEEAEEAGRAHVAMMLGALRG